MDEATRAASRFTQHRTVVKAAASDADWSVRAVLSLPIADLAGDVVHPAGLDFSRHAADPWVDLEHGFEPSVGRQPVGWARKSLALPGEPYTVQQAILDVPGVGKCKLPVGTTYFDRDHALQRQIYFMVRKGALPGVSLEFLPDWTLAKSRGPSPLERRDAYEFPAAAVKRWTHCGEPVCPGALTVLKSLPPELDALAKTLRDGRIENEPLHPVIVKSLARYKPTAKLVSLSQTVSPTVGKAMPDPSNDPQTVYDPEVPETGDTGDAGGPANNGVSALYIASEGMTGVCAQLEADLEHTDNPQLYREAIALCEQAAEFAGKLKKLGDKHDARLEAVKGGKSEPADDPDATPDMATDADGSLKAVRPPYRAVLKAVRGVKRYSLSEVQKGIEAAAAAAADAARPETLAEALARIRKDDPEEYERLQQKARTVRRLQTA